MTQPLQLEELLGRSLDYECGLIGFLAEVPTVAGEPDVQIYIAEYQDPVALFPDRKHLSVGTAQGSGAGLSREEAMWSTIGEAIERYSAHVYIENEIVEAAAHDVEGGIDFLNDVILFSKEDYAKPDARFHNPDVDLVRGWAKAKNLLTGEPAHVPASIAYMTYEARSQHEILDQIYSTGLASHTSYRAAILSGLCEVIERDAYTSHWLTKTLPLGISRSEIEKNLPPLFLKSCDEVGFEFTVAALPTDIGIPVFVTLASVPGGGIATGAACRAVVGEALTKSVVECCHTFNWCLDMKRSNVHLEQENEILSFQNHVAWYLDEERTKHYPWHPDYIDAVHDIPAVWNEAKFESELEYVVAQIDKAGYRSLYLDLTPEDIRELGFVVTKSFVPGLQPLSAGYEFVHTDTRRLRRFKPDVAEQLSADFLTNPPHAFP